MKTNAARILDALAIRYELRIRGTQILLAPADYLCASKAKVGPLTR
jgi:hypothetical protein